MTPPKKTGKRSENRVPVMMSDAELEAFDKAREKAYPLSDRSKVIRALIEKFVKETKA
jgi:metal-responsive CopG/Arc/MetJ family transcriptional regulator